MELPPGEHGQGESFSRRARLGYAGAALLLVGFGLYWYSMVVRADGAGWLELRLVSLSYACVPPSLELLVLAVAAGWAAGLAVPIRPGVRWLAAGAFLAGGGLLALFWYFSSEEGGIGTAPDWYCITLAVLSGGGFAGGYGLTGRGGAAKPLWPVLIVPAILGGLATAQIGGWGIFLAAVLLLVLADALGRWAISFFGAEDGAPGFVRGALGISLIILVFRISGPLGGAGPLATVATLTVLVVLSRRQLTAGGRSLTSWLAADRPYALPEWVLVGTGIALATVYWLSVLAPEVGSDAIGGRTALALIWSRQGSISGIREIFLSYMGLGGEILNLAVVALAGENVAKVTTFVCAIWLAGAFLWAGRGRGYFFPLLSCLAFFGSSAISWLFIHGFADLQVALLTVAAFAAFELWEQNQRPSWLFVAGVIGGSAVAIKLNAATVLGVIVLLQLWRERPPRGNFGAAVKSGAIFALGAALSLGPALVRSYLLTGNPVFPFAPHVFRSPLIDDSYLPVLPKPDLSLGILTLPFRTVLTPASFNELGTYHPAYWILALAALALLPWSRLAARRWWVLAGVCWLGWLVTQQNIRYSIPPLACTGMAISACGRQFPRPARGLLWGCILLFVAGFALNMVRPTAWMWGGGDQSAFPRALVLGRMSVTQFKDVVLPATVLSARVNATDGASAVIWEIPCFRDHQSFLGRTISFPHGDARVLRPLLELFAAPPQGSLALSPAQEDEVLSNQKITHLLLSPDSPYIQTLPESAWPSVLAPAFTGPYLSLEAANHGFRLYRLRTKDAALAGAAPVVSRPFTGGEVAVEPGSLIGLRAEWAAALAPGAHVDMVMFTTSNVIIYYDRLSFEFKAAKAWHSVWQTVPAGAVRLRLYPSPEMAAAKILLLRKPDFPMP